MKAEDQVCSLEQARRLKELGVKQEGAVFYYDEEDGNNLQYNGSDYDIDSPDYGWSAFTVAELGMMLPYYFTSVKLANGHALNKDANFWVLESLYDDECEYCSEIKTQQHYFSALNTEAQSRAAMLIYLLEHNLITVDEINARI